MLLTEKIIIFIFFISDRDSMIFACIYQDIDGKDQKAAHIFIEENKDILAYGVSALGTGIFKNGLSLKSTRE